MKIDKERYTLKTVLVEETLKNLDVLSCISKAIEQNSNKKEEKIIPFEQLKGYADLLNKKCFRLHRKASRVYYDILSKEDHKILDDYFVNLRECADNFAKFEMGLEQIECEKLMVMFEENIKSIKNMQSSRSSVPSEEDLSCKNELDELEEILRRFKKESLSKKETEIPLAVPSKTYSDLLYQKCMSLKLLGSSDILSEKCQGIIAPSIQKLLACVEKFAGFEIDWEQRDCRELMVEFEEHIEFIEKTIKDNIKSPSSFLDFFKRIIPSEEVFPCKKELDELKSILTNYKNEYLLSVEERVNRKKF